MGFIGAICYNLKNAVNPLLVRYAMLAIVALVSCIATGSGEMFTAMADMDGLMHTAEYAVGVINTYIEMEEKRLEKLKQFAVDYQKKTEEAWKYGTDYVANPVNAFLLIKRLTSDWSYVESVMRNNNADTFLQNITSHRSDAMVKFPDQEDLEGAARALARLQETYKLNTSEIAEGRVAGARTTVPMEAHDCFELGRIAYNQVDYGRSLMWMTQALDKLHSENPPTASESEILEYIAFNMFLLDNVQKALEVTKHLHTIDPNHPRAKSNIKHYEDMLIKQDHKKKENATCSVGNSSKDDDDQKANQEYDALCRGEIKPTEAEQAKLHCHYKNDLPFLKLAPLKVEVLHWKPRIVLYRQVLSDEEIELITKLAATKLERAAVTSGELSQGKITHSRISKIAWLKEVDHPAVARIDMRVGHMTNLDMKTAEDLQMANYGLGGLYDPHYDFARQSGKEHVIAFPQFNAGDRIATVLFYLSQPEAGGATVFPKLKLAVFPSKNDAVFWHNLYKSGKGDMSTQHAACPVLAGIKWASNKWIHEQNQEFRRPCALDEDEYE